jgi:hypothetical protein
MAGADLGFAPPFLLTEAPEASQSKGVYYTCTLGYYTYTLGCLGRDSTQNHETSANTVNCIPYCICTRFVLALPFDCISYSLYNSKNSGRCFL